MDFRDRTLDAHAKLAGMLFAGIRIEVVASAAEAVKLALTASA
jgi:hypothetical protein